MSDFKEPEILITLTQDRWKQVSTCSDECAVELADEVRVLSAALQRSQAAVSVLSTRIKAIRTVTELPFV